MSVWQQYIAHNNNLIPLKIVEIWHTYLCIRTIIENYSVRISPARSIDEF